MSWPDIADGRAAVLHHDLIHGVVEYLLHLLDLLHVGCDVLGLLLLLLLLALVKLHLLHAVPASPPPLPFWIVFIFRFLLLFFNCRVKEAVYSISYIYCRDKWYFFSAGYFVFDYMKGNLNFDKLWKIIYKFQFSYQKKIYFLEKQFFKNLRILKL